MFLTEEIDKNNKNYWSWQMQSHYIYVIRVVSYFKDLKFGLVLCQAAVLKISAILLKYHTLEGDFFMFSRAKKQNKIGVFVHFSIHNKNLIKLIVRKL